MRRKIYDKMLQWKLEKNGTTALLIEGARRIGKSWIAEEFARNEYESYILIDFSVAPKRVKDWFDEYLEDIDSLLQNIQLHYKKNLSPRKSIIIFDEATSFADMENEHKIQLALSCLLKGKTTIMIAHRLHTITGADQICVFHEGRLLEKGKHDELVSKGGRYADMWRSYTQEVTA